MIETYRCPNCGKTFDGDQDTDEDAGFIPLHKVEDLMCRILPGDLVPAGECPECGALIHLDEDVEQDPNDDPVTFAVKCYPNEQAFKRGALPVEQFSGLKVKSLATLCAVEYLSVCAHLVVLETWMGTMLADSITFQRYNPEA